MESDKSDSIGDAEFYSCQSNQEDDDFVIDHVYGNVPDNEEGECIENLPFDQVVELSDVDVADESVETTDETEEFVAPLSNFKDMQYG